MEVMAREISDELANSMRPAVMRIFATAFRLLADQIEIKR